MPVVRSLVAVGSRLGPRDLVTTSGHAQTGTRQSAYRETGGNWESEGHEDRSGEERQRMKAREKWSVDEVIDQLPRTMRYTETKLQRLRQCADFPERAWVLDIGAAQGAFVYACQKLGYVSYGVEPWDEARAVAAELAERLSVELRIVRGTAEKIPFEDESFHIVHADNVVEHVIDLDAAFSEAYRVLKPGGVFWFSTASSMCPFQDEIAKFPLFGWYPNSLKLRIMRWAKEHKSDLVGGTQFPAVNWFTPGKARRVLQRHGFTKVYDRWELRSDNEGGMAYRWAIRLIRSSRVTKLLADMLVRGCSYSATK